MKSIAIAVAALVGFVMIPARPVSAGTKVVSTTFITSNPDGSGMASGALGATRNSSNDTEYNGCILWADGGGPAAICQAQDAAGTTRYCYTATPRFIEVLKGSTSDEYLVFSWDAQGMCTYVAVYNFSMDGPKLP